MTHTQETKQKISLSKLGKPRSEEAKQRISQGMKQSHINSPILTCPYCGKSGKQSTGNMKRWHFSNCKKREIAGDK